MEEDRRKEGDKRKIRGCEIRLKERLKVECTDKDREVKRSVRKDKSKQAHEKAEAAEKTTENGRSKRLDTKMLTGKRGDRQLRLKTNIAC